MKIGITEMGDASLDLSWAMKLETEEIDGAILTTKDCHDTFIVEALRQKQKIIIYVVCSGYGGTVLEPNISQHSHQINQVKRLIDAGMPLTNVVLRIDPLIPTKKGFTVAKTVFDEAIKNGIRRYQVSLLSTPSSMKEKFVKAGLHLPYGQNINPNKACLIEADDWIQKLIKENPMNLIEYYSNPDIMHLGEISRLDMHLLNKGKTEENTVQCLTSELLEGTPCSRDCLCCHIKTIKTLDDFIKANIN